MTYKSKVLCDACQREMEAPGDGGFPFGWCEINLKPSQREPGENVPKRHRFHICAGCCADVVCIADMAAAHDSVAEGRAPLERRRNTGHKNI